MIKGMSTGEWLDKRRNPRQRMHHCSQLTPRQVNRVLFGDRLSLISNAQVRLFLYKLGIGHADVVDAAYFHLDIRRTREFTIGSVVELPIWFCERKLTHEPER